MPVMDVRKVRVRMRGWRMFVRMAMRFQAIPFKIMRMLMVHIVRVTMGMRQAFMNMQMTVTFGQV